MQFRQSIIDVQNVHKSLSHKPVTVYGEKLLKYADIPKNLDDSKLVIWQQ